MFFDTDTVTFEFLEAFEINQTNVRHFSKNRPMDALSFRFDSDAAIQTETQQLSLGSDSLTFFPKGTDYLRTACHDHLIVVHFHRLDDAGDKIETVQGKHPERYGELFKQILTLYQQKKAGYVYACSAVLYKILALVKEECDETACVPFVIEKSVDYMRKHGFDADFSLSYAQSLSPVSPAYFRKLFRQSFGLSPKQFLQSNRLNYAKELLSSGYYSVEEVADKIGYTDCKHFSTRFKKQFGCSPRDYRKTKQD